MFVHFGVSLMKSLSRITNILDRSSSTLLHFFKHRMGAVLTFEVLAVWHHLII